MPQTALDCHTDYFLMDSFCPGNILFRHAKNEVGVNPFCLFIRQAGNSSVKLLHSDFPLVQLMGRKCDKDSLMLQPIIPTSSDTSMKQSDV